MPAKKRLILSTHYPPHITKATDDLIRRHHDIKLPREMMEIGDPRWR